MGDPKLSVAPDMSRQPARGHMRRAVIHYAAQRKSVPAHVHPVLPPDQRDSRRVGVSRIVQYHVEIGDGDVACPVGGAQGDYVCPNSQRNVVALKPVGRETETVGVKKLLPRKTFLIGERSCCIGNVVVNRRQWFGAVTLQLNHRLGNAGGCRIGYHNHWRRGVQCDGGLLPIPNPIRTFETKPYFMHPFIRSDVQQRCRSERNPNRSRKVGGVHQNGGSCGWTAFNNRRRDVGIHERVEKINPDARRVGHGFIRSGRPEESVVRWLVTIPQKRKICRRKRNCASCSIPLQSWLRLTSSSVWFSNKSAKMSQWCY